MEREFLCFGRKKITGSQFSPASLSGWYLVVGGKLEWLVAILRPWVVVKVTHHGFYTTNKESMLSPLAVYTTSPIVLLCIMFEHKTLLEKWLNDYNLTFSNNSSF